MYSVWTFSLPGKHSNKKVDRPRISKRSTNRCPEVSRSAASWETTSTRSTWTLCSLQTINLLPISLVCSKRHTNGSNKTSPRACGSFYFTKSIDSQICHYLDASDHFHNETIYAKPMVTGTDFMCYNTQTRIPFPISAFESETEQNSLFSIESVSPAKGHEPICSVLKVTLSPASRQVCNMDVVHIGHQPSCHYIFSRSCRVTAASPPIILQRGGGCLCSTYLWWYICVG